MHLENQMPKQRTERAGATNASTAIIGSLAQAVVQSGLAGRDRLAAFRPLTDGQGTEQGAGAVLRTPGDMRTAKGALASHRVRSAQKGEAV